ALLDPGSFLEIGALCKTPGDPNALYGDGVVTGHGTIDGRPIAVFSHDQTVFQGSVGEMFGRKVARLMEWVAMVGCPIIGINDSAGARVLDAGARRVVDADDRAAHHRDPFHQAGHLATEHLADRALEHGLVVAEHTHRPAVYRAVAGDHAI